MLSFQSFLLALATGSSFVRATVPFYVGAGQGFGTPGNATFDYVVVGGGTAGLAVAYRLAEDGKYTVAVVEAGGFYQLESGNQSVVPSNNYQFASLQSPNVNPLVDWGFVTTPQPGANNRTMHYARGKTLGGCSAQNANVYNRGTVGSYKQWADAVGDSSYEFANWLPYFANGINYTVPNDLRAPNATVPTPPTDKVDFSPSGGPLHVSHSNYALPFSTWANKVFHAVGFPNISTVNNGVLIGAQWTPNVLQPVNNQRETSETGFLDTAQRDNLTNLQVYTHTWGLQVLFSPNKTATGVLVRSGRLDYVLSARKEVVVSAGAFQSPQLLMVSGIGPAAELQKQNISVIANRPGVGQNMWDHIDIQVTYEVNVATQNTLRDPVFAQQQKELYESTPSVSLYGNYGADYTAWEKLPEPYRGNLSASSVQEFAKFASDWPDVEYEIASIQFANTPATSGGYGTFIVIPVTPVSRGTVTLASNSMLDPPIINPNWLTAEADVEMTLQAVKRGRDIYASSVMAPVRIGKEFMPGANITTDAELLEHIRNTFFMNWHASCTCKMGRVNDTTAVVDSKARVIGVKGLRVVDASSFALLPPGHPVSTVYGLAEKIAADMVASR